MKKEIYLISALGLILLVLVASQFWIESSIWNKSAHQLDVFEQRIEVVENTINNSPVVDSLGLVKLMLEVQRVENKLEKFNNGLRNDFYWLLRLGIPLTVVGLLGFFYGIFYTTYNWALKMAKEDLIKETMDDSKYVRTFSNILLLNKRQGNSDKIKLLLGNHGFQKISPQLFSEKILEQDLSKYDALLLDSSKESGDFTAKEVKALLNKGDFAGVIMKYGGGRVSGEVNSDRFSGATMLSQLNPNLTNILIYQKYRTA